MKVVCLDTNVLIWGVQGYSLPTQTDMIPKAQKLISCLKDKKIVPIIPSPVIYELLMGVDETALANSLSTLNRDFRAVSFSVGASIAAAKLFNQREILNNQPTLDLAQGRRHKMRIDYQIIATAIANKCDCICSNDPHIKKMSGSSIDVKTIDELLETINPQVPLPLFDASEADTDFTLEN